MQIKNREAPKRALEVIFIGNSRVFSNVRFKKCPTQRLKILIASPNQIRTISLRKRSESFLAGRVFGQKTVHYKCLNPVTGGLFCERAFGSTQRGVCACKRTRWKNYPKLPKELRRTKIFFCCHCFTTTIYFFSSKQRLLKIRLFLGLIQSSALRKKER